MARSTRHNDPYGASPLDVWSAARTPRQFTESGNAAGVRWPLASRLVHQLFRVAPPPEREEWSESRAVADQRRRPPVGYRTKADLELEVQRKSGVSNKPGRS